MLRLRRLWKARKGRQPYPVVLLAPSDDGSKIRVAGPQDSTARSRVAHWPGT